MRSILRCLPLLTLFACHSTPPEPVTPPSPAPDPTREAMKAIFSTTTETVHWFESGAFHVAAQTDERTAARLHRYLDTFLPAMAPLFGTVQKPVRVYAFATADQLTPRLPAILGKPGETFEKTMGSYDPRTRSVYGSMGWGLGWIGDLLLRALLHDDWAGSTAKPAQWFRLGIVSMLYNSFRTPEGDFCGLNVVSYYRPQVQLFAEEERLLPFGKLMRDQYDEELLKNDFVRKQSREFLAYVLALGKLTDLYQTYRRTASADPTGITAVETVLGKPLQEIELDWHEWLLGSVGEIGESEMAEPFPVLGVLIVNGQDQRMGFEVFLSCPGSPAARAGICAGDRIEVVGDRVVNSRDHLVEALTRLSIGTKVELRVRRGEELLKIEVTLDRFIDG